MLVSKEKLAIKVAKIDGVQVDDVYFSESSENKVF